MLSLEKTLGILDTMNESPSADHLICTAQKCRKEKNLAIAKRLYAFTCNNGLENERGVGNYIVPMFVECGSMSDAQRAFNTLIYRTEHSWTSLILGHLQRGHTQHALDLYQKMREDSVHPSTYTLTALLKACARLKDMDRGRTIHSEIAQMGLERDVFVGNSLVDTYAKCGSLLEAREVFDKLPLRDVVSWTALIKGYAEYGPGLEALKCFEQMQLEGISPDAVSFVCILKACSSIRAIDKGQEIHREITWKGLERDRYVGNCLVDMYAKCDSLAAAQEVFNMLPVREVISWNALIAGYAEHGPSQEALKCFEQMKLEGACPSDVTFVCVLKACGTVRAIAKGREIHVEITLQGLERDLFVGNTLVDMYVKCRSLTEAQDVFDKLPIPDLVSWTSLIAGYAEHESGEGALVCFDQMQQERVCPNAVTFVWVLKACGSMGAIDKGRKIHAAIAQKRFEREIIVSSSVVDMYAKCGSLSEAQEVFDKLPVQDVVSWTSLIAGYAEHGPAEEALECFEQMQKERVYPSDVTFVCVLKACGSIRAIGKGRQIHAQVAQNGLERDLFVNNSLVDMYAKSGSISEAQDAFAKLPVRDVVSWTALIAGYADHGPGQEALNSFEQMLQEGIAPSPITFVCALKACGSIGAIDKGREFYMEISQKGLETDLFICNTLVDMYANCGLLAEAREVFDKLRVRDAVSWTALIGGHAEHGSGQEALKCFEQMQQEGISPSAVTFACVLKACGRVGAIDKGQEIHREISHGRFETDLVVGSALVDMYAKCGWPSKSQEVFDMLPVRNDVSWNALIGGYAEHGPVQEVLKCFERMQLDGVSPSIVTFVSVLKACGRIGAIDKGRDVHMEVTQRGFDRDIFVGNSLIDMYARCGSILEAWEAFDNLPVRDVVSWSAMIKGFTMNHEGNMAVQCFEDMKEHGVKPDAITFTSLLTACSHTNLVLKGQEYFEEMLKEYGIAPTIDHLTCIVDLLARSGYLHEAQNFFETMECSPCEETWTALLSACKTYDEAELGLRCFQQLVQMNSRYAASYILLENVYASAGKWDDAYRIEELRCKENGLQVF